MITVFEDVDVRNEQGSKEIWDIRLSTALCHCQVHDDKGPCGPSSLFCVKITVKTSSFIAHMNRRPRNSALLHRELTNKIWLSLILLPARNGLSRWRD